ncbi:MAG: NADH-quinone oxidoreductase subunit N, partial [Actinomycetota bacterium]|nr:NADH-quinone oxidoreductase subunit N [Actinomycetota bacterium]
PDRLVFDDTFAVDGVTATARLVGALCGLLLLGVMSEEVHADRRETEHYVLLLFAVLGTQLLAASNDLLLLGVGYLLASVPLYALAGAARTAAGTEAALKTYLLGAFLGIAMLIGITLLTGVVGGTGYGLLRTGLPDAPQPAVAVGVVALLAGLAFKGGFVPGHFWVPDAAEGSRTGAAALLTTVPKVGGLLAAYRVLVAVPEDVVDWPLLVALLAAVTMTLGNLAAFTQTSVRRLLGWSSVSQAGYVLMAVAVAGRSDLALPAVSLYLAGYAVTNVGAFAVPAALPSADRIAHYRGLAAGRPWLAVSLLVVLLGLVGTPPTAVFVGKLTVFGAALDGGLTWLVVVAALNTVASLFYYLRWLGPAFDRTGAAQAAPLVVRPIAATSAIVAAVASLALGVSAGLVLALDPQLVV